MAWSSLGVFLGQAGVADWSRAPVTEQYLFAAPPMWNKGWGVKTLFTFDPEYWKLGIHRPKMKNRHIDTPFPDTVKWLNGSGRGDGGLFQVSRLAVDHAHHRL